MLSAPSPLCRDAVRPEVMSRGHVFSCGCREVGVVSYVKAPLLDDLDACARVDDGHPVWGWLVWFSCGPEPLPGQLNVATQRRQLCGSPRPEYLSTGAVCSGEVQHVR